VPRPLVSLLALAASLALALAAAPAAQAQAPAQAGRLDQTLLEAVRASNFADVYDFAADPPRPAAFPPNLDVAVLELNRSGRVTDAANVILSVDHPTGRIVPVDRDLGTTAVRYRRWSQARFDAGTTLATPFEDGTDVVPGREDARIEFMSPYPASLFKLIVAYGVARQADLGGVQLDAPHTFAPASADPLCGSEAAETRTVRAWTADMIEQSSNRATCAMLKLLHDLDAGGGTSGIAWLNAEMRRLGLGTLQVEGTNPATGGSWNPGQINLTALDVARLLLIIDGGPGVLWRAPGGERVRARDELSAASRAFLTGILADQAFHEVLSTTNWCGHTLPPAFGGGLYPAPGIPARVADKWVGPVTGTVDVPGEGIFYPTDVRPCNAAAEVTFAHKTGLTLNFGADAGIVHSLPGRPRRNYIIAVNSSLGYRWGDAVLRDLDTYPCFSAQVDYVCYTEKLAQLGARIDAALTKGGRSQAPQAAPAQRPGQRARGRT
jgi:hypothetical protein